MRQVPTPTRFPVAVTILPTYTCTAACRDCCFLCSPEVEGRIPQARILRYISEASQIPSVKQIVFSGGECFVLGNDLVEAVGHASQLGLLTRCVSNGYWATSGKAARARLQPLRAAGLDEMNFSTGDQHQRWIPVERVIHGAVEAVALDLNVAIVVEGRAGGSYTGENLAAEPAIVELRRHPKPGQRLHLLQSPWISHDIPESSVQTTALGSGEQNRPTGGGCSSVLSTLVISPSEYLSACCGLTHEQIPEMRLGSLKKHSLSGLIDVGRRDFMKLWLMIEGPERILSWAVERNPSIQLGGPHNHHCDACRSIYSNHLIRQTIETHYTEKIPDIMFRFALFDQAGLRSRTGSPLRGSTCKVEPPRVGH